MHELSTVEVEEVSGGGLLGAAMIGAGIGIGAGLAAGLVAYLAYQYIKEM